MAHRLCPTWVGYLLLSPFRKLFEDPGKIFGQLVREGMIVLEPGCGMGYFTLPLARMVGPRGRVVAVEIQPKMLTVLKRRAQRAGLSERIELRNAQAGGLGVEDLSGKVDFATALHMVHEVADQESFFGQVWESLKPRGKLLVLEPKHHVSQQDFESSVAISEKIGFKPEPSFFTVSSRRALLVKPSNE